MGIFGLKRNHLATLMHHRKYILVRYIPTYVKVLTLNMPNANFPTLNVPNP
jgi:hypothetical protein